MREIGVRVEWLGHNSFAAYPEVEDWREKGMDRSTAAALTDLAGKLKKAKRPVDAIYHDGFRLMLA